MHYSRRILVISGYRYRTSWIHTNRSCCRKLQQKVISDTDAKVKGKVTYIRELQSEIELIADAEKDPDKDGVSKTN